MDGWIRPRPKHCAEWPYVVVYLGVLVYTSCPGVPSSLTFVPNMMTQLCHPFVRAFEYKFQNASNLGPTGKMTQEAFLGHGAFVPSLRCLWEQRKPAELMCFEQGLCLLSPAELVGRWYLHYYWLPLKMSTQYVFQFALKCPPDR